MLIYFFEIYGVQNSAVTRIVKVNQYRPEFVCSISNSYEVESLDEYWIFGPRND